MTPAARLNTITYMEDHWSELQKIKEALRVPGGRATLPGDQKVDARLLPEVKRLVAAVVHNVGIRGIRLQHVGTRWAETEGDPLDLPTPGPGMVVTHTTLEGTLRVQERQVETPTVWAPRDTWVYAGQTALVPTEPEVGTRA